METKRKISQIENNKSGKRNSTSNSIYKWGLYIVTIIVALTILFAVIYVLEDGISTIIKYDVPINQWLFGNIYSAPNHVSGLMIIFNTIWLSICSAIVATPISIGTAIIITKVLKPKMSAVLFSVVAILAAIPSVIYGSFGYYVIDKFSNETLNFERASLFTMIMMLAFMITPTITIMTVTSIRLTDTKLEDSSYALGANRTQTSFYITLRAAKIGIYTGILFAIGRCLAETTAISMVGSPSTVLDGATIVWWKQSLFLGPAILSTSTAEMHTSYPFVPLLSMFMILTTMSIFGLIKLFEFKGSESRIIKIESKKASNIEYVKNKYKDSGIETMTEKEQSLLIKSDKNIVNSEKTLAQYRSVYASSQSILNNSSISSTKKFESYKNSKAMQHNILIYCSAIIGILLLVGIVFFLFNGGFEYFTWDMLTLRGRDIIDGIDTFGLAVPIIGTYISMIFALLVALPIGVLLGICLSTYMNKDTKLGWWASYLFQLMTSIPGIVWGTIAAGLLSTTALYQNHIGYVPIIFMIFIILPSIIKSVEEAGGRVKRNLTDGSYALGGTVATTTRKIYIKEVIPSIISGGLLAMSIAMAESTIFLYILPDGMNTPNDLESWTSNGGYTLATLIYRLKQFSSTLYPEKIDQIKTIGIVLMIIILSTSYASTLINRKLYTETFILGAGILLFPLSLYIGGGTVALAVIALLCAIVSIVLMPFIRKYYESNREAKIKARRI